MPLNRRRIGERALECVVLAREAGRKLFEIGRHYVEAARIVLRQSLRAIDDVEGRTAGAAGLRQHQTSALEIEVSEPLPPWRLCTAVRPMKPAGDHQMQHQVEIVVETHDNPFP